MSLTGSFGNVEADYRRERITASFHDHRKARRHLLRRHADEPARGGE
jgi:hypothetical protein